MEEVKLTGNCLKGSRPILVFDKSFDLLPHLQLLKELFTQVFGTPKGHPKAKPFVDHVLSFCFLDNRIWFRNYQLALEADGTVINKKEPALVEIGPRFVLNPIRVFDGSFIGATLWENPKYISPNLIRRNAKKRLTLNPKEKIAKRQKYMDSIRQEDELADVFEE